MKNAGTVQVPAEFADEVEHMLRANPHVLSVKLAPLVFPRLAEEVMRYAA